MRAPSFLLLSILLALLGILALCVCPGFFYLASISAALAVWKSARHLRAFSTLWLALMLALAVAQTIAAKKVRFHHAQLQHARRASDGSTQSPPPFPAH